MYIAMALICHIAKLNSTGYVIQSPDWSPKKLKRSLIQRLAEQKVGSANQQNEKNKKLNKLITNLPFNSFALT